MIYLQGKPVEVTIFPDKTSQVWQIDIPKQQVVDIQWEFEHDGEIFHIAQLKDLMDVYGKNCRLHVKTFPYARQDKEVSNSTTFALTTFAKMLNMMKFDRIFTLDIHSRDSVRLVNNLTSMRVEAFINDTLMKTEADIICYPDYGATTRYDIDFPSCVGIKTRDPETGYIEGYKFVGEVEGKKVLIVDDLIDGGMTFIKCTEKLLQGGAKEVYLYASHGIFSKGTKRLFDAGISRIFTKDGEVEKE